MKFDITLFNFLDFPGQNKKAETKVSAFCSFVLGAVLPAASPVESC